MDKSMQVQCLLLTENDQAFPTSSSTRARYSVRLSSGEIVIFSAEELDLIMNSRFDCKPPNLPQWLHQDTKVMIYHNNIYLKGWPSYEDASGWEFQIRRRNGEVRFKNPMPHLLTQHSTMIDKKHILPGWSNSVRQLIATARHVSAKDLKLAIAPKNLRRALLRDAEGRLIWLAACLEEIQGLLQM